MNSHQSSIESHQVDNRLRNSSALRPLELGDFSTKSVQSNDKH